MVPPSASGYVAIFRPTLLSVLRKDGKVRVGRNKRGALRRMATDGIGIGSFVGGAQLSALASDYAALIRHEFVHRKSLDD